MSLAAGTRLGRYELLSPLGTGGMGEVYRARDSRLEREVAIKVLPERFAQDPQALTRFQREAKAVASLSHANILAIFDIGSDLGMNYAVMELLEGQTLGSRIRRAPLDWRTALETAFAIADGLAAAHAKGVIHRDIKPDNIFLTASGGTKILDFGLARLESKSDAATQLIDPARPTQTLPVEALAATLPVETQPGVLMGTVSYMSPEQARGQPADSRSDIFSFGCVLYEMLSGRAPFLRETSADTMAAILHEAPAPLTQVGRDRPVDLERVINRCLAKKVEERFQSFRDLIPVLKDLLSATDTAKHRIETAIQEAARAREEPSVAVLPFVNMSSDKENEYFSDGLAEELINALSQVQGLRVASRTSAFAFKGKNEDIRKIGEQLGVRTVLEGSVRKAGNRLRIHAQLINVADGYQHWSAKYDRQLEDVFAIQDEIAQNIAAAFKVILSEKDKKAIEKLATADVQAYDYYLRGRQFFHQFRRHAFEFARQMFTRAIEVDPSYARAYAGLADCYAALYLNWEASATNRHRADEASRKALELDPELAEAHAARGQALSLFKKHDEARAAFETAIRLNPSLFEAHYFYARTCLAQGKLEQAVQLFERASELRPEDYQALILVAGVYAGLGRKDEATAAYRRGLQAAEKHLAMHPDDARALYLGASAWCQLGDLERGLDWARRALAMDPEEPMILYNVACVYSLLGQVEEAIVCLEKSVKNGFAHKAWIENDADLNPLRGHPRYQQLLQRMEQEMNGGSKAGGGHEKEAASGDHA